jgi:hypothetical protein
VLINSFRSHRISTGLVPEKKAFACRVEVGYRFVTPWMSGVGLTPYSAGQFIVFGLPAIQRFCQAPACSHCPIGSAKAKAIAGASVGAVSDMGILAGMGCRRRWGCCAYHSAGEFPCQSAERDFLRWLLQRCLEPVAAKQSADRLEQLDGGNAATCRRCG